MEFNHFLSAYFPDTAYGGARLFQDMLEQARLADDIGYACVCIPEHHLINILLTPAPLQMAVKIAAETKRLHIMTSVAVLPLHDMRIFAGEVAQADILCNGRLILGVGRGAFAYEMSRLGVPLEISQKKFDESLTVLRLLLSEEEVSYDGEYYRFEPLTTMPRPLSQPFPPMMIAALRPEAIYHCAKRGYHVQTTPLQASREHMQEQVNAFHRGRKESKDKNLKLSLSRVLFVAKDATDILSKEKLAHEYYKRFDNVFGGGTKVYKGVIEPLPRQQTVAELAQNLLIDTAERLIERLSFYAEIGVDELIVNMNIGASQAQTLESMRCFGEQVMPHFIATRKP